MKRLLVFQIVFLYSLGFFVFPVDALNLECRYIYSIQEKYLDLHITYSNLNKNKPVFQTVMANLKKQVQSQFIKALDSDKLFFTVADVRNIQFWMKHIFVQLKKEDCSSLNFIYALYLKRVEERVQFANKYLNKEYVVDTDSSLVLDSKKRKRMKSRSEIDVFHRNYIQYQTANAVISSDKEKYKEKIQEAKKSILRYYDRLYKRVKSWDVNLSQAEKKKCYKRKKSAGKVTICKSHQWYSKYLDSYAHALDPHSGYLSQEDHEDFEINMRLSLDGIGATLKGQYGHTLIERLVPGGVAARSGKLKSKDKILAVGQSKNKLVNIFDMNLRDVVSMIRGERGTPVYLKILRKSVKSKGQSKNKIEKQKNIFIIRLIRDRVNLQDQAASVFYFDKEENKKKYKIAVILVPSFYGAGGSHGRSVSADVKKLLREIKKQKVSSVVLDLSNNGGGSLSEAVRLTGLFFKKGGVVRQLVKTKNGDRYLTLSDVDDRVQYSGPLIVLVNRVSASASEIVSGTLKSYKRAIIVGGDHTFGKGSIQSIERLHVGLGSIRVTVGLFFIPSGFSTQLKGVRSDIFFPSILSNDEIGEKNLDYFLPQKTIPSFVSQSAYVFEGASKWLPVQDNLINALQKKSQARIKKNKKFTDITQEIKEMKAKQMQGYRITIAEIFNEAKKEEKENPDKETNKNEDIDSQVLRKKRYRERPDIQEAVNLSVDQVKWFADVGMALKKTN